MLPLPHVCQHLTRLTLIASVGRNVCATRGFTHLVEILRVHARLPALILELHVLDVELRDEVLAAIRGVPAPYGHAAGRRRHAEIYRVIVGHLRKKLATGGLKALFLYIWWERYVPGTTGPDLEERRKLEREMEREVMGEGYDSERWGKELQRKAFPPSRIYPWGYNDY